MATKRKKTIKSNARDDIYSKLKDVNGDILVTPNRLYELNSLLESRKLTSEQALALLGSKKWENWNEFVYSMKTNKEFETKKHLEYELLLNKTTPAVYSEPCRKCNSSNTKIVGNQERAADEAGTARVLCNVCGFNSIL